MKIIWYSCFLLCTAAVLSAQTNNAQDKPPSVEQSGTAEREAASAKELPTEYRGIALGAHIDAVKTALQADPVFGYRGERDVSLLLTENRSLIETDGSFFINRSWFQFYNENLYIMIFKLNMDAIDYYSVYSKFCKEYGEPSSITPRRAVWENDQTRVVIERPLLVKYIDKAVFNELLNKTGTEKVQSDINRENFINSF